ncbi:hypothetical protein ACET3Z_007069 [Daucus carota]
MAAAQSYCFSPPCYPLILNKQPPSIFTTSSNRYRSPRAVQYYKPNGIYSPNLHHHNKKSRKPTESSLALALVMDAQRFQHDAESETESDTEFEAEQEHKQESRQPLPCQLYVCNLPSAFDISNLHQLFNPFGTVQSVEVTRDPQTGLSRGCGYVTMSSIHEAKSAISTLDGSDVGGRELRVMFAVDVETGRRNVDALNSTAKRDMIFESPYKLYAGNLTWSVKPEELRNLFCQFGTVVSARVMRDRKSGKSRVYGFVSFSSPSELEAAMALNRTDFRGRNIVLREVKHKSGLEA